MSAEPGIYYGMRFADYAALPALSNGLAKVGMTRSWFHARQYAQGKLREDSDAFDLGSAAHEALLQDGENRVVLVNADDWRTKAAKEARDEARASGKIALLPKQFEKITAMRDAALEFIAQAHQKILWDAGRSEVTLVWQDGDVACKARADRLYEDNETTVIWDYKTCGNAHPEAFGRDMARYWYDFQAAWYSRGARALGMPEVEFLFLAQESEYPYRCSLHALSSPLMEIAHHKTDVALRQYAKCKADNAWPDYGTGIHYQEPSNWQMTEHEQLLNGEQE